MSNRLLIGNLSLETAEDTIVSLFSTEGKVLSVRLISDPQSGRRKGFAIVEMATISEAECALRNLGAANLDGRKISINQLMHTPDLPGSSVMSRILRFFQIRCQIN